MSSKYIGATPFQQLLTHSIAEDETIKRAAEVLDGIFNKSVKAIPDLLFYARLSHDCGFESPTQMLKSMTRLADLSGGLAELPESVLDLIAWQFHVDGYESTLDIQGKRELVQRSIQLHRKKGTPWAVETALNSILHLPISVVEWYEYGGDPYHFRVRMDVSENPYTDEDAANAISVINEYKNVRSWLDGFSAYSKQNLTLNITASSNRWRINSKTIFWQPHPQDVPARNAVVVGSSERIHTKQPIYFKRPDPDAVQDVFAIGCFVKHENRALLWQPHPDSIPGKTAYAVAQVQRIHTKQPWYQPAPSERASLQNTVAIGFYIKRGNSTILWQKPPESVHADRNIGVTSIGRIRSKQFFKQKQPGPIITNTIPAIGIIEKVKVYGHLFQSQLENNL